MLNEGMARFVRVVGIVMTIVAGCFGAAFLAVNLYMFVDPWVLAVVFGCLLLTWDDLRIRQQRRELGVLRQQVERLERLERCRSRDCPPV